MVGGLKRVSRSQKRGEEDGGRRRRRREKLRLSDCFENLPGIRRMVVDGTCRLINGRGWRREQCGYACDESAVAFELDGGYESVDLG